VTGPDIHGLGERLFRILSNPDFLAMKGLANEVPIFIQAYDVSHEDAVRRLVEALTRRLQASGLAVKKLDLFSLVLEELKPANVLDDLMRDEPKFAKADMLDTLKNYSAPRERLIPRLVSSIGNEGTDLTLLTGAGRVFPFLRTHTILESLQPAMLRHPVVMFFPGEYTQDVAGGSQLRLFGTLPSPRINNPYYRALNLDNYRI
jgi:hypothetical protein